MMDQYFNYIRFHKPVSTTVAMVNYPMSNEGYLFQLIVIPLW